MNLSSCTAYVYESLSFPYHGRKLAHPNVVMLMGVCLDTAMKDPELIMVTQLMEVRSFSPPLILSCASHHMDKS